MKWSLLLLITLMGCAQVTSLNLRKHQFGILPTKIIWFQVAGLEEEQVAMLRFTESGNRRTSFEENICVGKTWNYNLYDMRNPAEYTFLSQMTGKKNIKRNCEDAELRPIWSYLANNGYNTGILEIGAKKDQSILKLNECGENGLVFLSNTHLWFRQEPPKNSKTFHYLEEVPVKQNDFFYDRTCSTKTCYSTILDDVKAIYKRFQRVSQKHLMIVRDFSYIDALERGDFKEAKKILSDLESAYSEALSLSRDSSDYLILLTTGDSRFVDMPNKGKAWYEFEKMNTGAQVKRTKLTNLVLASGARAENFCGMYEDSQVFERILSGPKQQGLELKIINPFK